VIGALLVIVGAAVLAGSITAHWPAHASFHPLLAS